MTHVFQDKCDLIVHRINKDAKVLDVGFYGQGTPMQDPYWVHAILKQHLSNPEKQLFGVDLEFPDHLFSEINYKKQSAESFVYTERFDIIFAGDLIEHLVNPGLFFEQCKKHLAPNGSIIITTPNAFNLFNLAEKISKYEPTTNKDHVCYFNTRTLRQLLGKLGINTVVFSYIYTLHPSHVESFKKKILNRVYYFFSFFTSKFLETLVVECKIDL